MAVTLLHITNDFIAPVLAGLLWSVWGIPVLLLARMIVAAAPVLGNARAVVEAISTADYPTAARRPRNSRLCCDRLAEMFAVRLPPSELSLANCLRRLSEPQT